MNIKEYLKAGLYSTGAVLRAAQISSSMYSLTVRGKRKLSEKKRRRLARVLGLTIDDIDSLLRGDYEIPKD